MTQLFVSNFDIGAATGTRNDSLTKALTFIGGIPVPLTARVRSRRSGRTERGMPLDSVIQFLRVHCIGFTSSAETKLRSLARPSVYADVSRD